MHNFIYLTLIVSLLLVGCSGQRASNVVKPAPELIDTGAESREVADDNDISGMPYDRADLPSQHIVYFSYDSSEIRPEGRLVLEQHAAYLRNNPMVNVRLEGHADERGTREYNLALGEQRGLAAQNILAILGVTTQQMTVLSYGEEMPLDSSQSEDAWQLNRRVELVYPF